MAARRTNRKPRRDPESEWHLDRRVPIALILAMVGQLVVGVTWVNGVNSEISQLKEKIDAMSVAVKAQRKRLETVISVEVELRHMAQSMRRLEKTLDRILQDEFARKNAGK